MGWLTNLARRAFEWLSGERIDILIERAVENRVLEALDEQEKWSRIDALVDGVEFYDSDDSRARVMEAQQLLAELRPFTGDGSFNNLGSLSDEDRGWRMLSQGRFEITIAKLKDLQRQARYLYYRDPLARNIIRNYTHLTMGSGVKIKYDDDKIQDKWDNWAQDNHWRRFSRRVVESTFAYGEWPVVFFPLTIKTEIVGQNGKVIQRPDTPTRIDKDKPVEDESGLPVQVTKRNPESVPVKVRGFDPREIIDVRANPNDSEDIQAVHRTTTHGKLGQVTIKYDGGDVKLFRTGLLGASIRGRPIIEPVMVPLRWYRAFLQDRVILNGMRTRIPIIRVLSSVGGNRVATEGMKVRQLYRPATILTVGHGEVWNFPPGNIGAGDAEPDGRAIKLYISAGVNLPEFLVTGNAATANKASLKEASENLKPMFDDFRADFGEEFEELSLMAIGKRGQAVWPESQRRDVKELAEANSIMIADGYMSKRTAATRMGLDSEKEKEQIDKERFEDITRGLALTGHDPNKPPMVDETKRVSGDEDEDEDEGGASAAGG